MNDEEREKAIIENNQKLRSVVDAIDKVSGEKSSNVEIESWFDDDGNLHFMFRGRLGPQGFDGEGEIKG